MAIDLPRTPKPGLSYSNITEASWKRTSQIVRFERDTYRFGRPQVMQLRPGIDRPYGWIIDLSACGNGCWTETWRATRQALPRRLRH